jgi:hypothetical protein
MAKTEQLSTYVSAIHRQKSPVAICSQTVDKSRWQDQDFEICKEVTTYRFDNGVVVQRTVEEDTFPGDLACKECWITYEVISRENSGVIVNPQRKMFDNACRELFWLAYHAACRTID